VLCLKPIKIKLLTKEQRYEIKSFLNCRKLKSFIAETLRVNESTIYRELKGNSTKRGLYNPNFAHEKGLLPVLNSKKSLSLKFLYVLK